MQKNKPMAILSTLVATALLTTTVASCGIVPASDSGAKSSQPPAASATTDASRPSTSGGRSSSGGQASAPSVAPVQLSPSVEDGASDVKVSTVVKVKASAGTVSAVKLWTKGKDGDGKSKTIEVDGDISKDGTTWTAASALDPGSKYRLEMAGLAADKSVTESKSSFETEDLTLAQQTYATIFPSKGLTVGVGMPVILTFDVAVRDRAEFQKHLSITSTGNQQGSWRWYGDKSVHFRPMKYWKPGTKVSVEANLNGVSAGNGIYGQRSVSTKFTVGRSLITRVNLKTYEAKVYRNGKLVKRMPVSGGKPGWRTRSGVKLIMAKEYNKVMTNEAIGAKEDYRLTARYAMRITNSGEFLHSAPWNSAHLGRRNASHGCVGMTTADSGWLYKRVLPGDPVITTGTNRGIEQGNGWSDWDISYKQYKKGSAL